MFWLCCGQVPVYSFLDLELLVTVADKDGRRFDNFSSLVLDWQLSDKTLAGFNMNDEQLNMETVLLEDGGRRIQSECYSIFNYFSVSVCLTCALPLPSLSLPSLSLPSLS